MKIQIHNLVLGLDTLPIDVMTTPFITSRVPDYFISSRHKYPFLLKSRLSYGREAYRITYDGNINYGYEVLVNETSLRDEIEYVATLNIVSMILQNHFMYAIHASAISLNRQAILFVGNSGDGKTTMASKFTSDPTFEWINDDRPFLYEHESGIDVISTPWMGKDHLGSNISNPLSIIYFVAKGPMNSIEEISTKNKISRLRETLYWSKDPNRLGLLLQFIERLIREIPIYLVTSANDSNTSTLVNNHLSKHFGVAWKLGK